MRLLLLAFTLLKLSSSAYVSRDFLSGFEAGIFVRDDQKAFDDYSCLRPTKDSRFEFV